MKKLSLCLSLLFVSITFSNCGGGNNYKFQKSQLDILIKERTEPNFSIILHDMDYDESSEKFLHQYQVMYQPVGNADTLISEIKDWKEVSPTFFEKHQEDMGMVIASKKDGVLEKKTAPPGYDQYIGNEKYGRWEQRSDGSSFWSFYGKYMFMSSMFNMAFMPVRYSYWNDYHRNYGPYGRSYYGNYNGRRAYGTNSSYAKNTNKSSRWQSKPSSFKQKVRSKVQASKSRTTRSSNRFRNSGSMRSRGGGFGK